MRFINNKLFTKFIDKIVCYRYIIYLVIFVLCVCFKVHGSSINEYMQYFSENKVNEASMIYGKSRGIRSDEYLVLTPYYISQTYNDFKKKNNYISVDGQNMIIGYNAPVKDLTLLCKPLNWGYVLLGKEYGLSWYWCLKQILLFALAFEVMYIFTRKEKILSIVGGSLVAFGPPTLWWFAPHMPDVILWSMGILVGAYYFFASEKVWLKNLLVVVLPLIVTEFVIAIFPSFQVSLGIFVAVMFKSSKIRISV